MREHLKWLVAARFGGKQIKLADALRVDSPWLSRYLTGRSKHAKDLDSRQLNDYHSSIIHYLGRAELPTETPTATEIAAAAVEAATTASAAEAAASTPKPAKPSPAAPVFKAAAPKAAVLSVDLSDVAEWREGGAVHIMALGVPVLVDDRWLMTCPGGGDRVLRLRIGLRGRRTISSRSHASVAGRTFEWWIEALDSRAELAHHGGPLWVAREVTSSAASRCG